MTSGLISVDIERARLENYVIRKHLPGIISMAKKNVRQLVSSAQRSSLEVFDNHPVTKEIQAGIGSENISDTLNGVGQLFSYIGFHTGSNPIQPLRSLLSAPIRSEYTGFSQKTLFFIIYYPTIAAIESTTPIPWSQGESWATGIEKGISGFGQYLPIKTKYGRSKGGLQISRAQISMGFFSPVPYLSEVYESFLNGLES